MSPHLSENSGADAALAAAKKSLRHEVRARLRALGPVDAELSQRTCDRLSRSALFDGARCVSLFRGMASEPRLDALEAALAARGVRVCYPRVQPGVRLLAFHLGGQFAPGALSIEEPHEDSERVAPEEIDVFVVPALALDREGNRLGHGRAHYDATLALAEGALRIGVVRDAALVPAVPVGEHDQPLDVLCTESQLLFCPVRGGAAEASTRALSAGRDAQAARAAKTGL